MYEKNELKNAVCEHARNKRILRALAYLSLNKCSENISLSKEDRKRAREGEREREGANETENHEKTRARYVVRRVN